MVMMCFTDAVSDESTKYKYGWVFIGILCANSGVNGLGMLILFGKAQLLLYKKLNNRCKTKEEPPTVPVTMRDIQLVQPPVQVLLIESN